MSRIGPGKGSLVWMTVAALFVPLLGLAYIAGKHGVLKSIQLELQSVVTSPGNAVARSVSNATRSPYPRGKLPSEVNYLFARGGKGPRADSLGSYIRATIVKKAPRQVVAAISPYRSKLPSAPPKAAHGLQIVNRTAKADRLILPVTHVARRIPEPAPKDAPAATTYNPALGEQISAAVFLELSEMARGYSFVALTEVDRSNVRTAALSPGLARPPGEGRREKRGGRYYGALMAAEVRKREHNCLAKAIYFESRGEPVHGQLAVAQVVMNRVRESYYPKTICGVVFEGAHRRNKCQFSFACDGRKDVPRSKRLWRLAKSLAKKTMDGDVWLKDVGHASHYHATYVRPRWIKYMRRIKRIGVHVFYRGTFLPKIVASAGSSA
ncbi:MAG: cell wall hydrolase [Methyloligellaceae bacterium]